MKILAIVVTYNANKWVDYCFPSLIKSDIPCDIICIDNNSSDNTAEQIEKKYHQVNLIKSKSNLGFGKANNIGLQFFLEENYDYALLLNQDAIIDQDTLNTLITIHAEYPNYGIISPIHRAKNEGKLDHNFSTYLNPSITPYLIEDFILNNKKKKIYETSFVNAAIWLMSKKCVEEVGLFDPIFPHYGEDTDYINRTLKNGLKVGIVPTAFGNHARYQVTPTHKNENFKSSSHHKYTDLLIDYKEYNGSKTSKYSFFIRKMTSELFYYFIMLDFKNFKSAMKAYTKLLKNNL